MTERSYRPRGGQAWRRRSDGLEVAVLKRRTVNPMEPVRRHSDLRWSLVLWRADGERHGIAHESDFVAEFEFLGEAR